MLGARLSCGHQVVLTSGIPVLCQYPIFTWAILLPILAVAYQGMKYHKKCIRKLCTPNCNNIVQKLDLNRKSLTGKIKSFVFLFCLFHFLDLNQILNPFQQLHPLHHERPFSMGMVHRVGSCIQLPVKLLYFPFPMPITEDVVAINGNGNKQKQKKSNKKFKTSSVVLKRIIKTRLMLVHPCLLYKNLNKNFEVGIDDIWKIC